MSKMNMKCKLDPYHLQIVSFYLKTKQDYLNIIQVSRNFKYLLDRFRINPIKITKENKSLFKYLDTQQLFGKIIKEFITILNLTLIVLFLM